MEPTFATVVLSLIVGAVLAAVVLIGAVLLLMEAWRTRGGHLRHEYAYGKGDTCNMHFITGR